MADRNMPSSLRGEGSRGKLVSAGPNAPAPLDDGSASPLSRCSEGDSLGACRDRTVRYTGRSALINIIEDTKLCIHSVTAAYASLLL